MVYDTIIIGGSAAATAAGIYAARRGLNFRIITKEFGGEVATSGEIGNWPGINATDGVSLAQQFKDHLKFYNVEPEEGVEVTHIAKQEDGLFCITAKKDGVGMASEKVLALSERSESKCDYVAKAVILTTGVHPRELNIPGEKEYRNKGVSYCTVCDGPIFKGKITATVGGGNSALESALMLADISSKVYVLNKNLQFKGEDVLINNLKQKKNVEIIYGVKTSQIFGEQFVKGLKYINEKGEQELPVEGIFVHIGMVPNSQIAPEGVEKNQFGEIKVNANCETNVPGLYAAGDVTDVPHKQIVIAAGQGTTALLSAVQYLNRQ
ncbi:MAG: FAD-dependent oxidoreductase [Candidatus Yanofskybacteria bacterium]|nr:FAD-dependent oxidoreductase [Candidatus Yanofskybacteria bacterium]